MSPFNKFLDSGGDNAPEPHLDQAQRSDESVAASDGGERGKRFASGRRQNSINGMQRRRNKRVNW